MKIFYVVNPRNNFKIEIWTGEDNFHKHIEYEITETYRRNKFCGTTYCFNRKDAINVQAKMIGKRFEEVGLRLKELDKEKLDLLNELKAIAEVGIETYK